jgi:hypothetical protein
MAGMFAARGGGEKGAGRGFGGGTARKSVPGGVVRLQTGP